MSFSQLTQGTSGGSSGGYGAGGGGGYGGGGDDGWQHLAQTAGGAEVKV